MQLKPYIRLPENKCKNKGDKQIKHILTHSFQICFEFFILFLLSVQLSRQSIFLQPQSLDSRRLGSVKFFQWFQLAVAHSNGLRKISILFSQIVLLLQLNMQTSDFLFQSFVTLFNIFSQRDALISLFCAVTEFYNLRYKFSIYLLRYKLFFF